MLDKSATFKVMREVLTHPLSKRSITECAKKSRVSTFAAKHALDFLLGKDMVKFEKIGNTHLFYANLDCFLTRQWKVTFSLEEVKHSNLVDNLLKTCRGITSIILYGSAATGTDTEKSDLDVFVIADVAASQKKPLYAQASGATREINLQIYTPTEWKQKAEKDKIFYEQAIINSIPLYGEKPVVL